MQIDIIGVPIDLGADRRGVDMGPSMYRWHIILRGPDPASLLRGRQLGNWRIEVNPPNLL